MANYTPRRAAGSSGSPRRAPADRSAEINRTRPSREEYSTRDTSYARYDRQERPSREPSYTRERSNRSSAYEDLEPLYESERPRRTASASRDRIPASSRERQYSRDPQLSRSTRSRRRRGGPPVLPLVVLLLLVVAAVVIFFVARGCSAQPEDQDAPNSNSSAVSTAGGVTSQAPAGTGSDVSGETSQVSSQPAEESPTPAPQDEPSAAPETIGGLMIVGDTAYEYYNFNTDLANRYIEAVAGAGKKLNGTATVYDMVVPTSIDIDLPESYIENNSINTSPQRKAIEEYIYPSIQAMNSSVQTVSVYDTLKSHANEYLYFRTDHHWTQLGAYYAYEQFCKARGFEPVPLDQFERKDYAGYLGSFYTDSQSSSLASNPDTVEAYIPQANVTLNATQDDGTVLENWPLIANGDEYGETMKYLIYAAGDQPYEEITNNDMAEGPSCIVVKESFGNCFLPFLVNHYKTVYVVDYRYYDGTVSALAQEKGVDDVLLLNNVSMTRNEGLINSFSNIF